MEVGVYIIWQWNGKDLFLKDPASDNFIVKSFRELPHELREHAREWQGNQIEIFEDGSFKLLETPEQKEQTRIRKHRHARILAEIAGFEGTGENNLPEPAKNKLADLRRELAEYEPADPSAVTLNQKRSLASWQKQPSRQNESLKFTPAAPVEMKPPEPPQVEVKSPSPAIAVLEPEPVVEASPESFLSRVRKWSKSFPV